MLSDRNYSMVEILERDRFLKENPPLDGEDQSAHFYRVKEIARNEFMENPRLRFWCEFRFPALYIQLTDTEKNNEKSNL